ncbi:S24 family peptidase [Candidatus Liberibacter americanus]|uniref:Putative transcriptional regulator n=1 Tax=Candidatus Liberibacter americanus str. Sao Paulo TaxID=1261131 RepID=U6B3F7_9HYPH|nr:helix-turn-helix transcriptional regulator [Candidatus Liberibacter americanus]AHA27455.1 putative transcriptional regulator [Candidatus Liberibacter americanus str. Sao Paulo]EMS36728.1 bacteriophage repressor protein C1 [Candidatus Liberibacter americanus PW_SP]
MKTFSHEKIWESIDRIANRHNLTPSGLARKAGLDPTSFNKSKRLGIDGRNRWPSTESIAKILEATNETIHQFLESSISETGKNKKQDNVIPILDFAQNISDGFFDSGGYPVGKKWNTICVPEIKASHNGIYAIQIQDSSMLPLYRKGDILILNVTIQVNCGDRVLIKTYEGDMSAKILINQIDNSVDLMSLNCCYPIDNVDISNIEWMAKILWASQ